MQTLGVRESGTASLEAAVDAFSAALEEFTYDCAPPPTGLSRRRISVWPIGQWLKSYEIQATLLQGIEAMRAALKVFEEGQAAFNIEKAKRNLANAEALLAELEERVVVELTACFLQHHVEPVATRDRRGPGQCRGPRPPSQG